MFNRILLIFLLVTTTILGSIYFLKIKPKELQSIISPFNVTETKNEISEIDKIKNERKQFFGDVVNILLIGTDTSEDRRNKGQSGFNTDSMILVSINTKTNRILLTSVPRDLWINGNKINALYIVYGEQTLIDAYEKITGQKIDGVIRVDFDQYRWLVDSMGGIPVNIENTFTDSEFPNQTDTGGITVSFAQGKEIMDGWRALTFARSRHGNNGEGSDLKRAKRQHLILQGFVNGINQENSIFWPMDLNKFYNEIKSKEIYTTLTLDDLQYLWDFYKDRNKYQVESLIVDGKYVYHPGMYPQSEYRAWVFIPIEPGFISLHKDIEDKLNGTYVDISENSATSSTAPAL